MDDNTDKVMHAMKNLLAVMNGDGGHFQDEHGMLASIKAATKKYHNLQLHEALYPTTRNIRVRNFGVGDRTHDKWYIVYENKLVHPRGYTDAYLWNDLTWHSETSPASTPADTATATWPGYYSTREEAEETLRKWEESQGTHGSKSSCKT